MRSNVRSAVVVESMEVRRFLAANPAATLAFAFPLGQADVAGVATDAAGNVYVAGHFAGAVDFNPSRRRTFAMTSIEADGDPFVAKYSSGGGLFWAVHFGRADANAGQRSVGASAIAVDAAGNVYLGGTFDHTVDFDPGAGTASLTAGANADGDGFVLGLDGEGAFRFAKRVPTPGTADPSDVFRGSTVGLALDPAGHVYATTQATKNFGTAGPGSAVVVNKMTATGRTLWTNTFGDVDAPGVPLARSLAVGPSGEVYLGGLQSGGVDFDPGAETHTLTNGNSYLLKLTPDGDLAWLGGLGAATPFGMTTDGAGNLYVAGSYADPTDFNVSPRRSLTLTPVGSGDAFVARYSAAGGLAWVKGMGGGGGDGALGVAVTADGLVRVTGQFQGRALFNPGLSRFRLTSVTTSDSFFATFTAAGVFRDAQQIAPHTMAVAASPTGGLFTAGNLLTRGDVDPTAGVLDLEPVVAGQISLFLLKLI